MTDAANETARAIEARDESPHEHGGETGWIERYVFDFFDDARKLGGIVAMDFLPGERRAQSTVSLFLPEGAFATAIAREPNAKRADLKIGRLSIGLQEPLARWTLSCKDVALLFPNARAAALPAGGQERHGAAAQIAIDLSFTALAPPAGSASRKSTMDANRFMTIVSSGWFAQPGSYNGTVRVGNRSFEVHARGFRERTWGLPEPAWTRARIVLADDMAVSIGNNDGETTVFRSGETQTLPARASADGAALEVDGIGVIDVEPLVTMAGDPQISMARFTAQDVAALGYLQQ